MSKLPTFLHIPSPSAAYPPQTKKAGSGQGRDDNNSNWVKVHQSQSRLDETLPVPVDFSVFLNQPINPFMDSNPSSNSNTQARTTMYVQDSGVVMISTSGLPRQPSKSKSSTAASSSQSSRESSTSRTKPAQSNSNGGGDEIDDDWEVVYPDN